MNKIEFMPDKDKPDECIEVSQSLALTAEFFAKPTATPFFVVHRPCDRCGVKNIIYICEQTIKKMHDILQHGVPDGN